MRLTKIKLAGFKSFVDPTNVTFPSNLTGVVGPNGCGKSNIVDALRWSLGEAGRGIRSKRVDEVIFAGSEKRRPLGLAEVSLSIANDDGLFDLPFTEIEIARRADRGGGQEYLLNRERIRLRDLNELPRPEELRALELRTLEDLVVVVLLTVGSEFDLGADLGPALAQVECAVDQPTADEDDREDDRDRGGDVGGDQLCDASPEMQWGPSASWPVVLEPIGGPPNRLTAARLPWRGYGSRSLERG